MITGIRFDQAEGIWPCIEGKIEKACSYSSAKYKKENILEWVKNRECQLWVSIYDYEVNAVAITQLINYPNGRSCYFMLTTGHDRELWQDDIKIIESWAKDNGCCCVEVVGRPGWEKVLKDYEKTHVFLVKDI